MRRCAKLTVLLLLSGAAAIAVAEEKAPTEAGWVRLPLPEYDRLLRAARRPLEKAPLDAAMTSSASVLEAEGSSPRLQTTLELISLSDKPQALSLPDLGVLYAADSSGDGASITTGDSGQLQVALARRGRFTLRLHSVPTREDKAGTLVLSWSVPDTPSNRFMARLPPGHENVTLTGGTVSVASERSGPVRVTGTLRRGETARLSYAVAASRAPEEKLLASASESRLYRLGEKSLGIASRLRIEVLRGTLRTFAVEAAADLTVTSAWAAENTVTSFERDPDHPGRLVLTLGRGVTGGAAEVFWLLERPARQDKDKAELPLPDIGLPDFLRGETAVAVISPRPLVLDEARGKREGYERIDEADLPAELREMADSTVLLALRRIGSGTPSLSIQVSSFPDAAGLSGVIDRAKVLTIAARDGSRIDRWQLEVQTRESFIRIPLPPNATLWSLQVDGKPARPLTEQGQLVIPLGRGEKAARARRIEIVLAMPGAFKLSGRGTARIEVPKLPFPITHTDWDLLLPETAQFRYAGGSVVPMPLPVERLAVESSAVSGAKGSLSLNNYWNLDGVAVQGPGQLSGRVVDEQGAALPGVTVTLIRQEGSYQRNVVTNAEGLYFFSGVPTGTFRIVASLPGFGAAERSLAFAEGGDVAADFKLSLATVNAQVTVSSEGALADRTMSSIRPAAPPPARRDAAKDNRQSLSNEERASLQRTSEAGVAAIAVELPTEGKRLHFEGNLLVDEAPLIELEFRPVKRGWLG